MQPVIIVGAGPTGLALALALARQDVPTQVFDSGDGVPERLARTCVLPWDTAHWARLPIARDAALPWESWQTTHRGGVRERTEFAPERAPVHLAVHSLEEALREAARHEDLIRLTTGQRITGIEQHPDGVTAHSAALTQPGARTVEQAATQGRTTHHGSYLVGCDGARSTVRKLLNIAFPGRTRVERYAVATLRADLGRRGEAALHRALPGARRPGVEEVALRPLTGGRWRLDWPLPGDDTLVTPEALLSHLHRTLAAWHDGTVPEYELLDTGVYLCHQRLARYWRQDRVFLAGDAAHLLGALGTQQVAEGLRDADNLAWKLATAVRYGGAPALLDSYQHERRTAVGNRLRAVDQALPLVRGRGGLSGLVNGRERGRLTLLSDAALGRGALGAPAVYDLPQPPGSVAVDTAPGAPVRDIPVTGLDGARGTLSERLGGPALVVLTAPGSLVWEPRHWLTAGLMPGLAAAVRALPLPAELVVAEEYPGAPAHTVLVIRPDGRLAAALPGSAGELRPCVELLLGPHQ